MNKEIRQDSQKDGRKPWGIVVLALLDDVAIIAILFVVLIATGVKLSVELIIVIGLIFGTVVFFVHRAILTSYRKKKLTGREGMLGLTGTVTEALHPSGTILVNGEHWKAESPGDTIEEGEEVEVIALQGLNLEVRRKL